MGNETKIGIDVQASTAAARAQLGALGEETRKFTEAGEAAGKAQKKLGQEVAETKARQLEATEAIRRVKAAQEEHNLTVQAFGPKSAQAKASADALSAANREAARAADIAAKALEKTTARAVDAAKAEGDTLSPATQRLAKQLQAMGGQADKTAQEMRKLDAQAQKTGYGFSVAGVGAGKAASEMRKLDTSTYKAGKGFDFMGLAGGKLVGVLGTAALGGSLMALGGWLGEASGRTLQYETAVANLTFGLEGAQNATHGLMSESKLAVSASQALALGVVKTEGQFNQLASDAAKIALKLGTSTDQMLGDLTTALGRGSAMILDNAGIILKVGDANEAYARSVGKTVEQLDEAEKKIAFQTAAMEAIRKSADATTVAYDGNAAAIAKLKVTAGDAFEAMERGAVNSVGAVIVSINGFDDQLRKMSDAADLMNQSLMRRGDWSQGFKDLGASAAAAAVEVLGAQDIVANFQRVMSDPANLAAGLEMEREKAELMAKEAHFADLQQKALEKIYKDQEAHLEAQAAASVVYGPELPPKEVAKKKGGRKKAKKDPNALAMDQMEFDAEIATYAAKEAKQAREDNIRAQEEAFERESAIGARKLERMDQELELFEAYGVAQREQVDYTFFVLDVETEAENRREAMLHARLAAEMRVAKWQVQNAKNEKQREEAQTRVEVVEHRKRMLAAQRAHAEEQHQQAQRAAMFAKVNSHITNLGDALVTAVWAQAEGEKGAVAASVAAYAKGVSQKMALKALEETALGVAALAGIVTAGLAGPHFAAAALAAAAAVAAGGAAVGFSKVSKSQAGPEKPKDAADLGGGAWATHADGSPYTQAERDAHEKKNKPTKPERQGGGGDDDGVPTSYAEKANYQKRNQATSSPRGASGTVNHYNFPGATVIGGTPEQVGIGLERLIRKANQSAGRVR